MALLERKRYQNRLWIESASGDFGHHDPLPIDPWVLGSLLGGLTALLVARAAGPLTFGARRVAPLAAREATGQPP